MNCRPHSKLNHTQMFTRHREWVVLGHGVQEWLFKVFVKHMDPKGKGGVVLFLNGSSTH